MSQENDDFETQSGSSSLCVLHSKVQECHDGFRRNCQVRRRDFFGVMQESEEPAGTHEKPDQSTGEVLFAVGRRDDRPIVDSGSVVSTCPMDYATSVPTEKVHYSMNFGVCGWVNRCNVTASSVMFHFTNRTGSNMNQV